jgi:hypothetical protein
MHEVYDSTEICHSQKVPAPPAERREQRRHMSVLRTGKLTRTHREELCLIKNISAGGLMAHVYSLLDVGEPVSIELKGNYIASGKVVWFRDLMAGVQFDELIDIARLLVGHQKGETNSLPPRLPRLWVRDQASLRIGGVDHRVNFHNISQGGAKIEVPSGVSVYDKCVVTVDGLPPIEGVLAWRKRREGGIAFTSEIPFDLLAYWAANRSSDGLTR